MDSLKMQQFTEKKLVNLSEKIEKKVLYYLSSDEQEQVYKLFSFFYSNNLDQLNAKQLGIIIKYQEQLNNIIEKALQNPPNQEDLFELLQSINYRNCWSQVHQDHINQIKKSIDQINSQENELDFHLFNQILIASESINLDNFIRKTLKSHKIHNVLKKQVPVQITHLNIIIRTVGDQYISSTLWKLYQEEILRLDLAYLSQQQFVYDHLKRYYLLTSDTAKDLTHQYINKERQSIIYINLILEEIQRNLENLNDLKIETLLTNCNLDDFVTLNRQIIRINIDSSSDSFIHHYLSLIKEELIYFKEETTQTQTEKLNQFIRLLASIDGFKKLKLQKKQNNPIDEIYQIIEEEVFSFVCKNQYELDLDGTQDPFAIELLKTQKQKSGKWKEEDNQVTILIADIDTVNLHLIYQIGDYFNKNQQGRMYFHYCIAKQLAVNFQKLDFSKQCDVLYYLAKIDKIFMIESNQYAIDYSQLQQLNLEDLTKCAIQLLFYNQISLNVDKAITNQLVDILHQNLNKIEDLKIEYQIAFYQAYELMRIEFPSIQVQELPDRYKQIFDEYWLYLQKETEVVVSDTKKFLDKEEYHYTYMKQVLIWKFLYVFEQDRAIVICLSDRFYLGRTNLNLIEIGILKRVLRLHDYKLRILDKHEYEKFETRHEKNDYIYEKLKYLSREPKKPKKPYFNI
ncbi:unnamed protein product (macronuclear) [Paramecium tetraurelia]|uniref:Uncharacterized protein n=1 Tax=Paramecium tetraurelia TaxID=5888 RepID=A0C0G1_PARTE|nr:uncharacterized protein GSPATT00006131001 [Paramecium tetraurelia]CAK64278.1 unnamed protein product [Paramecium tetraurelia]|eukprot:XP_001431676.1 hypothetical protein (macronuclear) [Paramecium tetraurelia strain d4-2]